MNNYFIGYFITQIILIIILIFFIKELLKQRKNLNLEKRIGEYSLLSKKEIETPFFEKVFSYIWKTIHKFSKHLSKSEVLKKYGKKFEKYITYDNKTKITNLDFISIKFLISFILGILYIVSSMFQLKFNIMFLILLNIFSFFILDIYLKIDFNNKRKQIEKDLLSAIIIMNNAFKSGMNIVQAVDIVKVELTGPISDEFKKISLDITYGLGLDVVFDRFYKRVKIEDAKYITSSLSLLNKTGGNIVRVFESIEKNFYDKKKIKDERDSLTSSSIFMYRMLIIMPILLVFIINIISTNYFKPFLDNIIGKFVLLLIILLFSLYIIVIKKVIKVRI